MEAVHTPSSAMRRPLPYTRKPQALVDLRADALIRYWEDNRLACGLPNREAFTPAALSPWLGHLCVYERVDAEWRTRLEGTLVSQMTGQNWTGRFASEIDAAFGSTFRDELNAVAETRQPLHSRCRVFQKAHAVVDRVLLPVTLDGTTVGQIFCGLFRVPA